MTEPLLPKMIEIPRGYFRMGTDSPPSQMYVDETPAVECSIDAPFAVGIFPVTMAEMAAFATNSSALTEGHRAFLRKCRKKHPLLPAIMTSWHDANSYCEWLSAETGHHYRLLTEREWEYVCRAGTESNYWWGDEFDHDKANSRRHEIDIHSFRPPNTFEDGLRSLSYLTKIDNYPPNPWGIYDMHGNTWEWVQDIYTDKRTAPEEKLPPHTSRDRPYRSHRGGSWMDPPESLRSAVRSWAIPSAKDRIISFRVARGI